MDKKYLVILKKKNIYPLLLIGLSVKCQLSKKFVPVSFISSAHTAASTKLLDLPSVKSLSANTKSSAQSNTSV